MFDYLDQIVSITGLSRDFLSARKSKLAVGIRDGFLVVFDPNPFIDAGVPWPWSVLTTGEEPQAVKIVVRAGKITQPNAVQIALQKYSTFQRDLAIGPRTVELVWKYMPFCRPSPQKVKSAIEDIIGSLRDFAKPLNKCDKCAATSSCYPFVLGKEASYLCPTCRQMVDEHMVQGRFEHRSGNSEKMLNGPTCRVPLGSTARPSFWLRLNFAAALVAQVCVVLMAFSLGASASADGELRQSRLVLACVFMVALLVVGGAISFRKWSVRPGWIWILPPVLWVFSYSALVAVDPGARWGYRRPAYYTTITQSNPHDAEGYNDRGNAKSELHDYQGAIADYTEAVRLDPQFSKAYYNRGYAKCRLRDCQGAIADYEEAIRVNPRDPDPYATAAWIWATFPAANGRDGKRAVEYATKACTLTDYKNLDTLGTLAAAYAEAGEFDKAVTWQKRLLELGAREMNKYALAGARQRLALYETHQAYRDDEYFSTQ